ncbi:piggyBac transposable element-derived protein 4-like [Nematostella vectensis]|uniref:piggyBac transposable element-derived protein 4-like n=1 Tax=Nematostella vectensis TaxID=45351 RepID=UPI0020772DC1|nr:piggyBac transposable element-derived protein 4-like [Nematostella vectensis]
MGGVDRADQLRSFYSSGWQSRKWYKYVFWFLFNLAVTNAFVLEGFKRQLQGKAKRTVIVFKTELAQSLIAKFNSRKRPRVPAPPTPQNIPASAHVATHVEGRKRACVLCSKKGKTTPKGYKIETYYECAVCKVGLCRKGCHQAFHEMDHGTA